MREIYKKERDILFKAMTRPAMFMGVPIVPFFIAFGICLLFAVYFGMIYFLFFFLFFAILRLLTKVDEHIFQLLGIKSHLFNDRLKATAYKRLFKSNYYTFNNYQKIKLKKKIENEKGEITMLNLENATSLEKIIPYSSEVDEGIILTQDGNYIATWQVEGISYETRGDEGLDRFKRNLNQLIRSVGSDKLAVYVHNVRSYSSLKTEHRFDNPFADDINRLYLSSFKDRDFMENTIFVSLAYQPKSRLDKINTKTAATKDRLSEIEQYTDRFKEVCERFSGGLNKFGSYRLTAYEENGEIYSEQLAFYNFLLTGHKQKIRLLDAPIYTYLGNIDMYFGKDICEIDFNGKKTFARGIEIKDWVAYTQAGLLDCLIGLNCRYVLTQSFSVLDKSSARTLIDRKAKQMKSTEDDSVSQLEQLTVAKDDLASGEISFGEHHFTLILYADSLAEIKQATTDAQSLLSDTGFLTTFSNISFDEAYFSQLPGNFKFRPRTSLISSRNFVGLNSLHNNPLGKPDSNCWGKAVTVLKTKTDQPFYFNFHQARIGRNDFGDKLLAHTAIIGSSSSGKTVLATFLMNQLMQYRVDSSFPANSENKKLTIVYFDKDYGAKIAVSALGGKYNTLENGMPTGFNPFLMVNTKTNIQFLIQLVEMLATINGEVLTTKDRATITQAVNAVMNLDEAYRAFGITRLLENIQEDVTDDNSLKKRLQAWSHGYVNGWVFDNAADSLSFDDTSVYGFDGTQILDNKTVIGPLAFYLLHRIRQIADGRRLVLIMDEFWKWLRGEAFRDFAFDGLKTFRKLEAFLICITQSPEDVLKSEIARAIVEQMETFIFLPNDKGDQRDYVEGFKLSQREYDIVRNFESDSREFLIKKGNENEGDNRGNVVKAKLDLSGVGRENLKVLSASEDNVRIFDKIISEVGNDPKDWLPIFKQRCV